MTKIQNTSKNTFFNTKKSHLSLFTFLIALGVLIILFGVGAAFDMNICIGFWDGLGHQEQLGRGISGILSNVEFFFIFTIACAFAISSVSYWKDKKWVTILSFILALAGGAFLSYFQKECFQSEVQKLGASLELSWGIMALAWVLCWSGAFCFAWFFVAKRVNYKLMVRAGLFLIIGACFIVGCNNYFLKFLWSRPRPSAVMGETPLVEFRPVWEIHPFECFNENVAAKIREQLKSFPSGHVSGASIFLISAVGITSLDIFKTKKAKNVYLYVAMGFMVIVAIARMIARCHFLTDVTAAAIIGLIIAFFMPWCYKRDNGSLLW